VDSVAVLARHPGFDAFLAQRCERCHTVRIAGIGVPEKGEGEKEQPASASGEAVAQEEAEADDPMDLSDVGETRTAEWLRLYLRREESIDGAKHYKAFGGTEEEEAALVEWLTELAVPAEDVEDALESPAADTEPPPDTED
jgi:hypothetical protein